MGATINIGDYNSVRVEYEGSDRAKIEAKLREDFAKYDNKVLDKYDDKPVDDSKFIEMETFTGENILHKVKKDDPDEVTFYTLDHKPLISPSRYYRKEFDREGMAEKSALKHGVDVEDVLNAWDLKRDIGAGYGKVLHNSIQMETDYPGIVDHIESAEIVKAVQTIPVDLTEMLSEVIVSDSDAKRMGIIDLLNNTEKGYIIYDIKSGKRKPADWKKQLQYYRAILDAKGFPVYEMNIIYWNMQQQTWTLERID